jgi:L,D-peptidoglycan transpeptidase YkuD (ErfK/YbiS/YcfS/YnhG family)
MDKAMALSMSECLDVSVESRTLHFCGVSLRCAIGKAGAIAEKREGDGKTPLGSFALRKLFFRADRVRIPAHPSLSTYIITSEMGWCDDPLHPSYNQLVKLPFAASHEMLWREDNRYDIIIPLGYNDSPVVSGLGSAIFFHLASEEYTPTEGCVAIAVADMLKLLPHLNAESIMHIR